MKTNFKSIICLILAIAFIASLAGCAGKSVPSSVDSDGYFVYSIVRPGENGDAKIADAAKIIRTAIKDNFDVSVSFLKDVTVEDYDNNYEILVGETNREESSIAIKRLEANRIANYNDFIVKVINDKICIYSKNLTVLNYACQWFADTFCKDLESWGKLKSNYEFIYEHTGDIAVVPNHVSDNEIGVYHVVLPRYASYLYGMVAEDLVKYHQDLGYVPQMFEDIIDKEQEYEILIGDCDREASKSVTAQGDNFVIKVIGKKIVIKGGNDLATREGALYLFEEIKKSSESGQGFNWSDGHTINGKYVGDQPDDYTLNWYDEFEATNINYDKWSDYLNYANTTTHDSQNGGTLFWYNCYGESKYTGPNLQNLMYQSDGNLHLCTQNLDGKNFAGALISTSTTMIYRYGLIEIREKFADEPAACSLWQNGANTSSDLFKHWTIAGLNQDRSSMTEMDIFEDYGQLNYFTSTLHKWWSQVRVDGTRVASGHSSLSGIAKYHADDNNVKQVYDTERYGDKLNDTYHTMSCYWDGTQIRFAIDGKSYLTVNYLDANTSASSYCLMDYLIMSCRMSQGGYCSVNYDNDVHPKLIEAKVDYVRIYQREDQNSQMLTTTTEKKPDNRVITVQYPNNDLGNNY